MKKYHIVSILLAAVFLASCSIIEEDPKGKVVFEGYFNNAEEVEAALMGMYKGYQVVYLGGWDVYLNAVNCGADDLASLDSRDFRQFDMFQHTAGMEKISLIWRGTYAAILRANVLLDNEKRIRTAIPGDDADKVLGQAHLVRGLLYFNLVRIFNDDVVLQLNSSADLNAKLAKNSQEVYDLIIADLEYAGNTLPPVWAGEKKGVAFTKGAAKAILADVYLTMAGYPLKKTDKYGKARDLAKEIIDNEAAWGYGLLENIQDLWTLRRDQGYAGITNKEQVVSAFADDEHIANVMGSQVAMPREYGGWDIYYAEINFFEDFPAGPRKDATFEWVFYTYNGDIPSSIKNIPYQSLFVRHPFYKKYWWNKGYSPTDPKKGPRASYASELPNYIIRYPQVLLTYAEAQAQADGTPNSLAYECINRVRNRAGLDPLKGLSKDGFVRAAIQERAWEFAGVENGIRWFDLVRTEGVEAAAKNRSPLENPIPVAPGKTSYFFPIPPTETDLNPNLKR